MWSKRFWEDSKLSDSSPIKVYCVNKATISIAHNPILYYRTKHIKVDRHFIKEKLDSGQVCLPYIPTTDHVADIFAKGLHKK